MFSSKIKLLLLTSIVLSLTLTTAITSRSGVNESLTSEIYKTASVTPCDCRPGDANEDGAVTIADAVFLINYVFRNGPGPTPYPTCSGDPNADCSSNVGDAVIIIEYIFKVIEIATCEEWVANCGEIY